MLTLRELDRIYLEAELEIDALLDEYYEEFLGDRAEIMALLREKEMVQAEGEATEGAPWQ